MLLLQAIPHCRFGQVLLGGFGGLKHGAYVCYMFLRSTGFATKLALMFLEAIFSTASLLVEPVTADGGAVSSFSKISSAEVLVPLVGNDGPAELGLF